MNKIKLFSTVYILVFTVVFDASSQDWKRKVSPSLLENTREGHAAPFLILLTDQADVSGAAQIHSKTGKATFVFGALQQKADQSQKNITAFLDAHHIPHQSLYVVNAVRAEGSIEIVQALAMRNDVASVIGDQPISYARPVHETEAATDSRSIVQWGIGMINADDVWALGYTGQGITVGGEDTGYEWFHPALKEKYRGYNTELDTADHNYNWHDAIHTPDPHHGDTINPCGYDVKEPCDDSGHGTHTMGTMVGSVVDTLIGVAPDAQWCACRNMERGYGTPFTYIECFQWFLAPTDLNNENPDPAKAPHVINNSWGCPPTEGCDSSNFELMNMVVNNLRASGIVVVVSAGNEGSGCSSIDTPAAIYEGSFSIGATRSNDTIAGYSSRGPVTADHSNRLKPNVSAPGSGIFSSVPGGEYDTYSGTSMAGPHVVGLVALMISANPALAGEVDLIENIIESTAVPKTTDQQCGDVPGSEVPNNTYGFGRVDALAAVEAALALIPTSIESDQPFSAINIYPNPLVDQLMIGIQQASGSITMDIFDIQGKSVMHQQWDAIGSSIHKVDVSAMPSGFYVCRIHNGNQFFQVKVVKQ